MLGTFPQIHAVHSAENFMELELGDWKENRRYVFLYLYFKHSRIFLETLEKGMKRFKVNNNNTISIFPFLVFLLLTLNKAMLAGL